MHKKRGFLTQLIRHLIQFTAFILFPGLFIMVFSAVRDLLTAVIDGSFSFGGLFPQMLLVFAVFLITALWGRFFCGFLCSFGMLQELLFFFFGRMISKKIRIPQGLDSVMKLLKYMVVVFITAGVWILALPVDSSWNPWGVFGMLVSGNLSVASAAVPTVGFGLLLAIAVGALLVERFFCRYLCPLGALFALVSGKRLYKIRRREDSCTNCGLCTRACSMGIRIPEKGAVVSGECIQCMECLSTCPKGSLSANPAGAMAGTAAAAAIGGTVIVGNLVSFPAAGTMSGQPVVETERTEKGNYKDGVYTGTGEGFRGAVQVQVTVEEGYIADITVLSFRDDREFFQKAQSAVIEAILTEQTPDVDAVSGATFSSNGIMDAVADALESCPNEPEQPPESSMETGGNSGESGSGESRPSEDSAAEPSGSGQDYDATSGRLSLADGIYEGSGNGFRGTVSVSVTVENGMITDITINSYKDDSAYFARARDTVISEIISTQSPDVQAVSGATFSSNGIMEAVADALGIGSDSPEQPVGEGNHPHQPGTGDGNGQGQSGSGGNGRGQSGSGDGNGRGQSGSGDGNGRGQSGSGDGNGRGQSGSGDGNGRGQSGSGGNGRGQSGSGGNGRGQSGSGGRGHGRG